MFDTLTHSLDGIFKRLRGYGRVNESNVRDALREVRMALLEADVNYAVARDFIARVQAQCLGETVLSSITPGQQIVKRVHEELVALLGGGQSHALELNGQPATVMLVGLHGSGKTTTAAKLARFWKQKGRSVLLVAADIRRPAAVDQLAVLGKQVEVEVLKPNPGESVPDLGTRALDTARRQGRDILLVDTGGRFQIEAELIEELTALKARLDCRHVLLVVDAAIGQESVSVAQGFHRDVGLNGLILTKLDGDARGGAALSIQSVTGCPVLFTGSGERPENLEPFQPDRMASRILGMGDVVSLVEKVQATVDDESAARMEDSLHHNRFDLNDFRDQLRQLRKMGSIENLLEMLPNGREMQSRIKNPAAATASLEGFTHKSAAILDSMTAGERRHPDVLNASRRRRIASGSGTQVSDINDLMRQYEQMRRMTRNMGKLQKKLRGRR